VNPVMGHSSRAGGLLLATGLLGLLGFGTEFAAGYDSAAASPARIVTIAVDTSGAGRAISPLIYGMNFPTAAVARAAHITAVRFGGNSTSRYNYSNKVYNTGSDWFFENIAADGDMDLDLFVARARAARRVAVVTVPMTGWVSKDSPTEHPFACGFPVSEVGGQDAADQWDPNCGNGLRGGKQVSTTPERTSVPAGAQWVRAEVRHLRPAAGTAADDLRRIYQLDNEPTLWNSTHRDVHPLPLTYDELGARSLDTAAAVKSADPRAAVLGPGDWGWCGWYFSAKDGCQAGKDAAAHDGLPLGQWYLRQFKTYADAHGGTRLLDYFDEHVYPQSNVGLRDAGDATTQALRLRSTRMLWDPTYVDESWIARPVEFLRTMRSWIEAEYPGTRLAVTEYNFGGLESLNGALAQAEVLGLFGREGVDLATLWGPPALGQPGVQAFRLFTDYDGHGARFGDLSLPATSSSFTSVSVFASRRSSDGAVILLLIDKDPPGSATRAVSFRGLAGVARAWRYDVSDVNRIRPIGRIVLTRGLSVPAASATILVLPART
jgi:hypothetical protein